MGFEGKRTYGAHVANDSSSDKKRPLANPRASASRSSVVLSLSILIMSLAAAGQAVAIVMLVSDSAERDAFFAAYSCYLPFVLWAASVRGSLIPLIGAHGSEEALRERIERLASTVYSLGVMFSVALALSAPLAAAALTDDLVPRAEVTARASLFILAPAVTLQFAAASLAAGLAAARRFSFAALTYAIGSTLSLLCTTVLIVFFGVLGAPVGLLIGASTIAIAHAAYARRFGLQLHLTFRWLRVAAERLVVVKLLAAAALLIAQQLNLAIALAALPGDEGAITAYTLAFFLLSLLLNVSFSALALALMPDLTAQVANKGLRAAERQLVTITAHSFFILAPLIACFLAFGKPFLDALLGPFLARDEIAMLYRLGTIFSLMAIPYGLFLASGVIIVALQLWRRTVAVAATSVAIQAAVISVVWGRTPEVIAIAHGVAMLVTTGVLLAAIFGRTWQSLALRACRAGAPAMVFAAVFPAARLVSGSAPPFWRGTLLVAGASAVYVGLAFTMSATFREATQSLVRRRPSD
jgi:peptidoglycan biosynthesis protein MviN/MurJ (putative lipid II flippase)